MTIKKIGHCCLLIKLDTLTILTDPGAFSSGQDVVTGIDLILITHEHADHFHADSLRKVLVNNPQAKVIANKGVGNKLGEMNIPYTVLEGRDTSEVSGVLIEAFDCKHEEIFGELGQVQNTGYFIDGKLFYPGDSFCDPEKPIDVLALPVAGPWCKVPDAIRYALSVRPRKAFPVHDGMLQTDKIGSFHKIPEKVLSENGIEFVIMNDGDERDFA